jgi:hypothetical protein
MIVMRIEQDHEAVGLSVLIAARELPRNSPGFAVPEPDPDVQRVVVVRDAQLGRFRCRLALVWLPLDELCGGRSSDPHLVVQAAVDDDWRGCADRLYDRDRSMSRRLLSSRKG